MTKDYRKVNFTRTISIPITQKVYDTLKEQATTYSVTVSAIVRKVINKHIKQITPYEEEE
jgi:predicted DNA-binding protein